MMIRANSFTLQIGLRLHRHDPNILLFKHYPRTTAYKEFSECYMCRKCPFIMPINNDYAIPPFLLILNKIQLSSLGITWLQQNQRMTQSVDQHTQNYISVLCKCSECASISCNLLMYFSLYML